MNMKETNNKDIDHLNAELLSMLRKQLNLRIQAASGKLKQTHLLKELRKNIARIKTALIIKTNIGM